MSNPVKDAAVAAMFDMRERHDWQLEEWADAFDAYRDALRAEVERLTRERDNYRSVRDLARDEVYRLRAEVERLRGLVHEAYVDGFLQHSVDFHYQAAPPNAELAWEVSDARAALVREGDKNETANG